MPLSGLATNPEHLRMLEEGLRSYRPEELFDEKGAPVALVRESSPAGTRRMGSTPHANGGIEPVGGGFVRATVFPSWATGPPICAS